jgi:hypothetical protein
MFNPITYINTQSRAHPVLSSWVVGAACFAAGYTIKGIRDFATTYVPEARMGIISDLPTVDLNGDNINDRIVTRTDGRRFIIFMDKNGKGKGVAAVNQDYKVLEDSLNCPSSSTEKLTPFIPYLPDAQQPQPDPSNQPPAKPTPSNYNPSKQNNYNIGPELKAQITPAGLENKVDTTISRGLVEVVSQAPLVPVKLSKQ